MIMYKVTIKLNDGTCNTYKATNKRIPKVTQCYDRCAIWRDLYLREIDKPTLSRWINLDFGDMLVTDFLAAEITFEKFDGRKERHLRFWNIGDLVPFGKPYFKRRATLEEVHTLRPDIPVGFSNTWWITSAIGAGIPVSSNADNYPTLQALHRGEIIRVAVWGKATFLNVWRREHDIEQVRP